MAPSSILQRKWLVNQGYLVIFSEWNSSPIVKSTTRLGKKLQLLWPMSFSLIHAADFAVGRIARSCRRSTHVVLLKEWLEARGYAVVNTGLRRSELAGRGIERVKTGNTLDPLTLNLL